MSAFQSIRCSRGGILLLFLCSTLVPLKAGSGSELINVDTIKRPPLEEIRYATTFNFTGARLYPYPAAFVRRELIPHLEAIQSELATKGLGLKIYDGYRTLSIQQKMWDLIRDERFVSNPAVNRGRHTRGTAVDVTLVDSRGKPVPMPSDFDEFSPRAAVSYAGGTREQRSYRDLLQRVMTRHGFLSYPDEWWHFDFKGWQSFPVLSVSFQDLKH